MHGKWFVIPLVVVLAGAAQETPLQKELARLQGEWLITDAEKDGKPIQKMIGEIAHIKGNSFHSGKGDNTERAGSFQLQLEQNPKGLDTTYEAGELKGKTIKGIFTLDATTWKLCYAPPGKDRPGEFTSKGGNYLFVFKRKK